MPDRRRTIRSKLRSVDIGILARLHADGMSQTEIAQRVGCTQGTVSRWIDKLTDTRDAAKSYLHGAALDMAEKVHKKGRPSDHVKVLEGIQVLDQPTAPPLVPLFQVGLAIAVTLTTEGESHVVQTAVSEAARGVSGSDRGA